MPVRITNGCYSNGGLQKGSDMDVTWTKDGRYDQIWILYVRKIGKVSYEC